MKKNRVKELWKKGKPAVQGWCSTANPYIAEMMAHAGFDAVVIDWQHGVGATFPARTWRSVYARTRSSRNC